MRPVRIRLGAGLLAAAGLLGAVALAGPSTGADPTAGTPTAAVLSAVTDDAGDDPATTTNDGPLVHRRAAIAVVPRKDADRAEIRRQLQAAATREKYGTLSEATFAVFDKQLLDVLVPEVTVVLPEGRSAEDAEVLIRDYDYPTVGFAVVQSVLVHDITFAVLTGAAPAAQVRQRIDREGVLTDELGRYHTDTQAHGLTIRYFGALLSDGAVQSVRESMARAAGVSPERVVLEATSPGPGVDLSHGVPRDDGPVHAHG